MNKINFSDGENSSESKFEPRRSRHSPGNNSNNDNKKSFASELLSTVFYIVIALIIFLLIRQFLFAPVSVDGESMAPTLEDKDRLILNKVQEIERFDVIVFPAPDEPEKQYIKRVIGLPGDEIRFQDDVLYINGDPVDEPYLDTSISSNEPERSFTEDFTLASVTGNETVPEGSYFVMGDNRTNSKDSRSFGFIDATTVTGTTDIRIWPFEEFGTIHDEQ